ncbi:MAG: IS1634 family transposase [Bryobacterales bacterium]|nr:IS1634 family transposase [Bryobacterales bacterium]
MYIDVVPNRNSPPAVLLREGWREGKRVRKRTIANLSSWPKQKVDALRKLLRNEHLVSIDAVFSIVRSLPHGHVELLLAAFRKLRLPALLDRRNSPQRRCVLAMIAQRLLAPASKLATTRLWHSTTLAEELQLQSTTSHQLYSALDWLHQRQPAIQKRLAKRHLHDDAQVLYDVSSSYYEGSSCPLARFGYNRDGKRGTRSVVYGLMTDRHGRPIAVRAYPGNTADPNTVADQADALRDDFGLQRLVLIGDRGMLTDARIADLRRRPGLGWISALRHGHLRSLAQQGCLQPSLFDERNLATIHCPSLFPGEQLVVCYNPLLAQRRGQRRERLLEATEEAFQRIQREVGRRTKKPLKKDQIGVKVGRQAGRYKMAKHFRTTIEDSCFQYERDEQSIQREKDLDGLYIVRTSQTEMEPEDAVRSYKQLTRVEKAFRCLKSVDLHVRPIFHRLEKRVRAHLFVCLLAYYVEWHLRGALAELLHQHEDLEGWQGERDAVAAAEPPEKLRKKKNRRTSSSGLRLHSFSTLMAEMGTRSRHQCRARNDREGPLLVRVTEATEFQQRVYELWKTFPVVNTAKVAAEPCDGDQAGQAAD